jgi:hypothetical protein
MGPRCSSLGEVSQNAVANRVENPTTMRSDQAINDDPVSRAGVKSTHLISPHQPTVARDIGGKNRGELSFDGARFQSSAPPQTRFIYRPSARSEGFSAIQRPAGEPSRVRTRFPPSQRNRRVQAPREGLEIPLQALRACKASFAERCCSQSDALDSFRQKVRRIRCRLSVRLD